MGRKLHFVLCAVLALVVMVFGFGDIAEAKARRSVRFDSVAVRNTGELSQELRFEFYEVRRGGRIARQPRQKFTIGLAGGGSFRWERVRFGRVYLLKVTRITAEAEELILTVPYVAVRGVEGRVIEIPGEVAPVDPRDELIAMLQAQIAALELEMQAKNADIEGLLAQIGSLQQRITDLLAGTPVTGPALTVMTSSATPPAKLAVMGSVDQALLLARLSANNADDLRKTEVVVTDSIAGGQDGVGSFQDFTLWNGATKVAGPTSMSMSGANVGTVTFTLAGSGIVTPKNGAVELTVKATVATYASGGAVSGSQHRFTISASGVTVRSVGSPTTAVTVLGSAMSNTVTVARTKLVPGAGTNGATTNRWRGLMDEPWIVSFAADTAYAATLEQVTLVFRGGTVPASGSAFTVDLVSYNSGYNLGSSSQANAVYDSSRGGWVATFTPNYQISAGNYIWAKVRINSSNFADAAGVADTLSISIDRDSDVRWSDGTTSFSLESGSVPLQSGFSY